MIRTDDVRDRIEEQVSELQGRVRNAGEFTQLVESNAFPADPQSAFILPGPLRGGAVVAGMGGAFVQQIGETVIVVLVARAANDASGAKAMDTLTPLIRKVTEALCGWSPADAIGTFALGAGELVGSGQGRMLYHLEFVLDDQLRIFS
jgi:hypothetical protein